MPARALTVLLLLGVIVVPSSATAAPAPAPAPAPHTTTGANAGAWGPPLDGALTVTRPFERLPHPYAAGHRGVDLQGRLGGPVLAAGDGVVVFAGMVAGRPVVSVDHPGGLRTTYEPVDPSVAAGQPVTRGSPIGTLTAGHAGCPVHACLHWGLRRGETYLDPMALLRPTPVRLLPMR